MCPVTLTSVNRRWTSLAAAYPQLILTGLQQPPSANFLSTLPAFSFTFCSLGLLTNVIRISVYITSRGRIICEQLLTHGVQGSSCNLFLHFQPFNLMEREIQKVPLREYYRVHPGLDLGIFRIHVRCNNA
jgi:hypothetical protein